MTKTESTIEYRTTDRAPIVGDLITVTPKGARLFEVIALDDIYGEMVYAAPAHSDAPGQWHFLTYVRVIDDEPDDACHCAHPDCGAC
jgi:hypothetical protein